MFVLVHLHHIHLLLGSTASNWRPKTSLVFEQLKFYALNIFWSQLRYDSSIFQIVDLCPKFAPMAPINFIVIKMIRYVSPPHS